MRCALCLFVPRADEDYDMGEADDMAVTVINGQAVCYFHMGYVAGGDFTRALGLWKEARHPKPAPVPAVECREIVEACRKVGEHSPICRCSLPQGHAGTHMSARPKR